MAERTVAVETHLHEQTPPTAAYGWNPETTYAYTYNQYQQSMMNQLQQTNAQFYPQQVTSTTPTAAYIAGITPTAATPTPNPSDQPPGEVTSYPLTFTPTPTLSATPTPTPTSASFQSYGYWPLQQQQQQSAADLYSQQYYSSQQYAEYYRQYYQYQQQQAAYQQQQAQLQQQGQLQFQEQQQQQQQQVDRPVVSFNIKNAGQTQKSEQTSAFESMSENISQTTVVNQQIVTLAQQEQQQQKQQQSEQQPAYVQVTDQVNNQQNEQKEVKSQYSPMLQDYIKRSFKSCGTDDASMEKLKVALKEIIQVAKEQGVLYSWDWASTAVPLVNDEVVVYQHIKTSLLLANTKNSNSNARTVHLLPSSKKSENDNNNQVSTKNSDDMSTDDSLSEWKYSRRSNQIKNNHNQKHNLRHSKSAHGRHHSDDDNDDENENDRKDDDRMIYSKLKRRLERAKAKNRSLGQSLNENSKISKRKNRKARNRGYQSRYRRSPDNDSDEGIGDRGRFGGRGRSRDRGGNGNSHSTLKSSWNDFDTPATTEVIQGTCQEVEKEYFRLTSAPDPSQVRPEQVLKRAYGRLIDLIKLQDSSYNYKNYFWTQFKAIRQDLVVQHIQNEFTVRVYEANARAALEYGDMAEFNQCLSQLSQLYDAGLPGCGAEFAAYQILYRLSHPEQTNNNLLFLLQQIMNGPYGQSKHVQHAVNVRKSIALKNFIGFFKLYRQTGNLGCYLMDVVVDQMRFEACDWFVKSHKPSVLSVEWLSEQLGFVEEGEDEDDDSMEIDEEDDEGGDRQVGFGEPMPGCAEVVSKKLGLNKEEGVKECLEWLKLCGAIISTDSSGKFIIDTKQSAGNLTLPREENAVAHGDANLDISDFIDKSKQRNI